MGKGGILDHGNSTDSIGNWFKSDLPYGKEEESCELSDRRYLILAGVADHCRTILWRSIHRNWRLGNGDSVRMRSRVSTGIKTRQRLKRDQIQWKRKKKTS